MKKISNSDIHTHFEKVEGKNIVISGGTTGIGRAAAILLASYGANIIIFGRHKNVLSDALKNIKLAAKSGAEARGLTADQAKFKDIDRVFRFCDRHFKKIDIFINNAGIGSEPLMKETKWHYVIDTNLSGYMACTKEAVLRMKKNKKGHIINIGSMSAYVRKSDSTVYAATKAAVQKFTEALREELCDFGIKVTLIEPGKVGTDMQKQTPAQQRKLIKKGEMLRAEDLAVCIYYCLTQPLRCDISLIQIQPYRHF
jgi:short-subunit dehydrogenase